MISFPLTAVQTGGKQDEFLWKLKWMVLPKKIVLCCKFFIYEVSDEIKTWCVKGWQLLQTETDYQTFFVKKITLDIKY